MTDVKILYSNQMRHDTDIPKQITSCLTSHQRDIYMETILKDMLRISVLDMGLRIKIHIASLRGQWGKHIITYS